MTEKMHIFLCMEWSSTAKRPMKTLDYILNAIIFTEFTEQLQQTQMDKTNHLI